MNITMLHDLDTGFLAATLKPAFEKLGHKCTVIQTLSTYLEGEPTHIDHMMSTMSNDEIHALKDIFKNTDLFIIRSITDFTLKHSDVLDYTTPHNTVFKVHGSELRERGVPYTMKTWRMNWYNKEPVVCGPRDPSLIPLYRENTITHIERPCAFDTFPKRRRNTKRPFALTTPTNIERKGTQYLIDNWSSDIPLQILHGTSREQVLRAKSQCSYYIDNIGSYAHGPYGMNSVEAWYYKVPVFSTYNPMDEVVCPELPELIYYTEQHTIQAEVEDRFTSKKQLNYARKYALHTHDPDTIAQQYTTVVDI
jgi:hypothetical protein